VQAEGVRRLFERGNVDEVIDRYKGNMMGNALDAVVRSITDDADRAAAIRRHFEAVAEELAGPGAIVRARLLTRNETTPETGFDAASGRLYRVGGLWGGMEMPAGPLHRGLRRVADPTEARNDILGCFGRSDRRAQGDRSTLRSIRPTHATLRGTESDRSPVSHPFAQGPGSSLSTAVRPV
jgi:hypothetical protein